MKKYILFMMSVWFIQLAIFAQSRIIEVFPEQGKDIENIALALKKAADCKGRPVTVKFSLGIYQLDRAKSSQMLYYISNTTSELDDPDPTKHIGLYLNTLKNITIDGCGSTLLMNGEMTSFVLDKCEGIVLKNFNIDYKHPTQTEVEVLEEGNDYLIVQVHPTSQYRIVDEQLEWYGDGWSFKNGIAQSYASTSMVPTLKPQDIVLVDRQDKDVMNFKGRIMLVLDPFDGSGKIKRVAAENQPKKRDYRITYYSDNAAENPPEVYSLMEDFDGDWNKSIVGRVVWAWSDVSCK